MLKLAGTRQWIGRWIDHNQPCFSKAVILKKHSELVMRLLHTTTSISTAVVVFASFLPTTIVNSFSSPATTRLTTTAHYPLTNNNRIYSTRDRTEKDTDEVEDDLYILAASDTTTTAATVKFASTYHAPVMWKECVLGMNSCVRAMERQLPQLEKLKDDAIIDKEMESAMVTQPLIFVDGTLGGGGHSQALLESLLPGDIVFGADVDPDALRIATERLSQYTLKKDDERWMNPDKPWFVPVPSNFADITPKLLRDHLFAVFDQMDTSSFNYTLLQQIQENGVSVDGVLLDLGVSSYQIDTAERGFAFMKDGPLNMRMDRGESDKMGRSRLTAADLCNELDISELRRIFKTYGDEPRARAISESIIRRRPLVTTNDLFEAVAEVTPQFARKGRRLGRKIGRASCRERV